MGGWLAAWLVALVGRSSLTDSCKNNSTSYMSNDCLLSLKARLRRFARKAFPLLSIPLASRKLSLLVKPLKVAVQDHFEHDLPYLFVLSNR